jgi:hypothetical protein
MSIKNWSKQSSAKTVNAGPAIVVLLMLLVALVPVVIAFGLLKSGITVKQIVMGGAGTPGLVAMAIVGTVGLITAVMWLVFPWLAWWLLSRIHAELAKIEENTRRI